MKLLFIGLFSVVLTNAYSQDVAKGATLYNKCTSCHGQDGYGKKSQNAPLIAGQEAWYVQKQVKAIKSGERSNSAAAKMVPFVKNLKDDEIADLAAYIATMKKR
jgi:cytochrome c553